MPARARREIVDSDSLGYYHCYSRCVRLAFLCGNDPYSGKNYDHRKDWVEQRLQVLACYMAVDVLATMIMDNHYHLVVWIRPELVEQWTDREVARRWLRLCPGTRKERKTPPVVTDERIDQLVADRKKLEKVRKRLSNLSWFMKFLNEFLARKANAEEDVSGHFFEQK